MILIPLVDWSWPAFGQLGRAAPSFTVVSLGPKHPPAQSVPSANHEVPIEKCQSRSANHEADTVRPTKCPKVHCLVMWVQKAYKSRRVRAMAAQPPLHPFCPVASPAVSNKPTDSECNSQRITSTLAPEGSNMSKCFNAKTCIPR